MFEKDGRGPSPAALLSRGLIMLVVAAAVVGLLLVKSTGRFDDKVEVTALLEQLGDGLPARSDVKFRGLLVGTVAEVTPASGAGPNRVRLTLDPTYADRIPRSVTARVVPSNVFAVSSVQLVDNGPATALSANAEIPQDRSLSTVQLQTALTKLREIIAATARIGTTNTVGVLAAVAEATDRRGTSIVEAGRQLDRITREFDALLAPDGGPPTLTVLADAVRGLNASAPDLLDALHHAVTPMRTVAEHDEQLVSLLAAGNNTLSTVGGSLDRRTDQIVTVTEQMGPVLDVFAAGSPSFTPIVMTIKKLSDLWFTEFWNSENPRGRGKFQFRFTPHTLYTRADCQRYGQLAAPSCSTAPESIPTQELPATMDPRTYPTPPDLPVDLQEMIRRVLGGEGNGAESILGGFLADGPLPSGAPR
nr:MCE family protein [Nocardia bovistercoris]